MDSPLSGTSRLPGRTTSPPGSPIAPDIFRAMLEDCGHSDNLSNCSEDVPPQTAGTLINPIPLVGTENRISFRDEQETMRNSSPISRTSYFSKDRTEFDRVGPSSPVLEAGSESEGDTIKDMMNVPYTKAVPAPVQDFSLLYPGNGSVSDDTESMRSYRERVQEKLRKQVLTQENESKIATSPELTELYMTQDSDGDDAYSFDGTDFPSNLYGSDIMSESFRTRSVSSIELNSDPVTTLRAPDDLPFSTTPSRKATRSSRSSQSKATSPFKRRRKASSPDELAELARVAAIEEAEAEEEAALRELEKYREVDLAPLEPIMESKTAGDLLVHGTPVKVQDREIFGKKYPITHGTPVKVQDTKIFGRSYRKPEYKPPQTSPGPKRKRGTRLQLQTPQRCSMPLTEQDEKHNTGPEISDIALQAPDEHRVIYHANHPPFINVIEALPATIFWCTVAAITRYSMNVFDAIVERLTGLSVEDA